MTIVVARLWCVTSSLRCVLWWDKGILILHETGFLDSWESFLRSLISPCVFIAHHRNLKFLSYSYFKYLFSSFLSFFSFWYSYYVYVIFLYLSHSVWILCSLVCFHFLKISLLFNLEVSIDISSSSRVLSLAGIVYWGAHQKNFFHFCDRIFDF